MTDVHEITPGMYILKMSGPEIVPGIYFLEIDGPGTIPGSIFSRNR